MEARAPWAELSVEGTVAKLVLARPPVNALNTDMLKDLEQILERLADEKRVAVLRVRSRQKVFSAGADLKEIGGRLGTASGADEMRAWLSRLHDTLDRISALPMLTVAEVDGAAMGGGLELALACDLRIVSERAKFGLPEVKVGLLPGAGGTQRLTTLCGTGVARRLVLTGETLGAAEALRVGLAQWVFSAGDFQVAADELSARTSNLPIEALREAKTCLAVAASLDPRGRAAEIDGVVRLIQLSQTADRLRASLERSQAA